MKRNLFAELTEGLNELKAAHKGKATLHTVKVEIRDKVEITGEEIRIVRESLNASQAVMARRLRVNERTWQNWEQGRAKPNAQAAILIKLVEKHPEMLKVLETL
ncbi:helix-turn-helix domain-containing protein [Paraburkholderia phymatum]|uniref:helix-turn-helix domain-containing protein n=1 Tax=Paraburkholderia phymatum TaxID=148447 RepID=UPI0031716CE9